MKQEKKQSILKCISTIFEGARKNKLQPGFMDQHEAEIATIIKFLDINKAEAYFASLVFGLSCYNRTVDMADMFKYMDCNPLELLQYNHVLDSLNQKGILQFQGQRGRSRPTGGNDNYLINKRVVDAILNDNPPGALKQTHFNDILELLEYLWSLSEQLNSDEITLPELFTELDRLLKANKQLPLVKHVLTLKLDEVDAFMYLMVIWDSLHGKEGISIDQTLRDLIRRPSQRIRHIQSFHNGKNELIRQRLCALDEGNFLNDSELVLTDRSCELLQSYGLKVKANKPEEEDIIKPDQILTRELIFNKEEMKQLELLSKTITEPHFTSVRERLASRNMPMGITAVLHGPPGTGKTESVKQVARITGRDIMEVDISETKSMWFGKSEKLIKGVFRVYRHRLETSVKTPILLFNEADGVLSTRRQLGNSNVGQTENAMQNILLDELEKFDGILIATTNLITNLDKAFERRFLFKIKLGKPGPSERAQIWKLKLPGLSKTECDILAGRYHLSGGQIDNIARKREIQEIINGSKCNIGEIINFCEEEAMERERSKIGYI